jgi:hypothetical protein
MTSTSDDGSPNTPVELPKHETEPAVENMGLTLELPDDVPTLDAVILTADEQRRLFEEAGVQPDKIDSAARRKKKR